MARFLPPAALFFCVRRNEGQALTEGVVVMAALLLLWVMSGWLIRLQDLALQASNASRYAAFDLARQANTDHVQFAASPHVYFSGLGQQWRDLRGRSWLANERAVRLSGQLGTPLPELAQPGGANALASTLRLQWALADTGVREVTVTVAPKTGIANQPEYLQRQAFIAVNAGHASDDGHVVRRVRASGLAWAETEQASRHVGLSMGARLQPLDDPWSRPEPTFDWLKPWQHNVPSLHLQDHAPSFPSGLPSWSSGEGIP